jgi:curved DNA-binding protein
MTSGAEIRTEREARAILKLAADAPPSAWRAAFQREVKAAHPDQGGDSERVRLVIEAYKFLKTTSESSARTIPPGPRPPPRPHPRGARTEPPPRARAEPPPEFRTEPPSEPRAPRPEPPLRISIVEAFRGAERLVRLRGGRRFKVRLPAGLQTGDVVRFGDGGEHRLTVQVECLAKAELKGADLWLEVAVSSEFLREGGRIELDTPLGPRKFWVSRTSAMRGLYRVPHEGLPARAGREKGHLFLKFEHDPSLNQSPSKSLLQRFASVWAAE